MSSNGDVGLVLAGGGARGAYEAGALSVLQPWLESRGERPTVAAGTSVGAINAAHFAGTRHLAAAEAGADGVARWSAVDKDAVIRPIVSRQAPLTLVRYAGEILSLPGVRVPSLLDPAPLARNLPRWIDWPALHANVADGTVGAVAAVATGAVSGRTVVFVEGRGRLPASHAVRYAATQLGNDHIRASAAIPILFPPVRLDGESPGCGWYVDGGTRLNTPIKPALDLGAERLVIIATDATSGEWPDRAEDDCPPPDFGDGALHLLQGMLVDPLIEDLRRLGTVNAFLAGGAGEVVARLRSEHGRRAFRRVPYLLVAPARHGTIGELASAVFRERYGGLRALRSPDMRLLNRLLGGDSPTHGELLSYLFFDPVFLRELAALGAEDARRVLANAGDDGPWRFGDADSYPVAIPSSRVDATRSAAC
jgi:NTE family protein